MLYPPIKHTYTPYQTAPVGRDAHTDQPGRSFDEEPPRKPDWLLIMVLVLFVLTLSVAWYVSVSV